jgi:hypothetical protein
MNADARIAKPAKQPSVWAASQPASGASITP